MNRFCLLVLVVGLSLSSRAYAQTSASGQTGQTARDTAPTALCDPDLIDGTFTFASLPAGEQTVSLHFRNTGKTACRLEGPGGPSFAVDGHGMNVAICWMMCDVNEVPLPIRETQAANGILLAPGEVATVDTYWASTGASCQWADWVNFFFTGAKPTGYLFIPSEWPLHICSRARSAGYRVGADSPVTGAARDGGLRVKVSPEVVYNDERATVRVELTGAAGSEGDSTVCGDVYTVRHQAGGFTRLDPLTSRDSRMVTSFTQEQIQEDKERAWPGWRRERLRRCNIAPGGTTAEAEIEASTLADVTHIEWRMAGGDGAQPEFVVSPAHFTVLDPDSLPPNWGEVVKGIHAGLSVDRESFKIGERIPVHLRWENVNAAKTLGQGECGEPSPELEIQDSQHHVLRTVPAWDSCMGHGWGPFSVPADKKYRNFRELTTSSPSAGFSVGLTPDLAEAGVYYLVSVWSPRVLVKAPEVAEPGIVPLNTGSRVGEVYATVRSQPVRVEVLGSDPATDKKMP